MDSKYEISKLSPTFDLLSYVKLEVWAPWRWVLTRHLTLMLPDFLLKLLGNDKLHQAFVGLFYKVG